MRCLVGLAVPALVIALGCSASDPVTEACGGARPPLASCVVGSNWADCGGGEIAPRFGCTSSQCFWFAGGCVAEGHVASPCPADDLCCVASGPFDAAPSQGVSLYLTGWGTAPWDRERARDVAAELGSPAPIASDAMSCEGDPSVTARGPCSCPTEGARRWSEDVLVVEARASCVAILFWSLSIEVTRDDDRSLHARVCRVQSTDVATATCPPAAREPVCADAGTVTLDAFPESLEEAQAARVDLSVSFPDGVTIDAQL